MLIGKCALIREQFIALPTFLGLPVRNRNVLQTTATDWPLSISFEDTVSGKETGNQGFEKYWRFISVDNRTLN